MSRLGIVAATLVLIAAFSGRAHADAIEQVNFTVNITSGSENGLTFTGSYTFDASLLSTNQHILSFSFSDPAYDGRALSDPAFTFLGPTIFGSATGVDIFFSPGTGFFGRAFAICGNACGLNGTNFAYGTTDINEGGAFNDDGFGIVTFGAPITLSGGGPTGAAPEPGTLILLGSGLLGFVPRIRRMA